MSNGPALYLGRVGSTGTSTGPHAHWQVKKDGKLIPLSTARTDIGQYIQFRRPGQADWTSLYTKGQDGNFALAPGVEAPEGTSAFGMREKHPVHGDRRMHWGEDYKFDEGTQLRFLGQGSVSTHASRGGAGNVSALRLPSGYELETLHLSELPGASTTRTSDAPTPAAPTADTSARTEEILKAFMYGQEYKKEPKKTFEQGLKEQLVGGLISQALNPMSFLSSYSTGNPFLSGRSAATSDFLGGILG